MNIRAESDILGKDTEREGEEENNNPRFGDRRSNTEGSIKKEDELFDDLARYNDSYDPVYYQTDIKRFETLSNTNAPSNNIVTGSANDIDPLVGYVRTYSRQPSRRKSISSKNKLSSTSSNKTLGRTDKLIRKRKMCRFISLLSCIGSVIAVIFILYYLGMKSEKFQVSWTDRDLYFNLKNCRLFIQPCTDCSGNSLVLDYRSSIKNIFYNIIGQPVPYSFTGTPTSYSVTINHYDDILGCNLYISVPTSIEIKSMNIVCTESCVLIQRNAGFRVNTLTIQAENISTNFAQITVGSLDIFTNKGYIQFNNLNFKPGTFSRNILVGEGDIIIETPQGVSIQYVTASENYCFSGATNIQTTSASKSNIAYPLNIFITQIHLQNQLFTSQWSGVSSVCPTSGCSAVIPQIQVINFDGNIFLNVLETIPGLVSSSAQIQMGSRYGDSVDIPLSSQLLITSYQDLTQQSSLPNLIIKFIFGNVEAWSLHGYNWVYTDHPIYSIIKPWWISFFTLGKLVENTNEVKTFLSPGFCPYRQTLGIMENTLINKTLISYLRMQNGVLQFLKPADQALTSSTPTPRDGFMSFAEFTQFSDEWVGIEVDQGEDYTYKKILLTENIATFLIIIASVVISFLVSLRMANILKRLLFKSFQSVREKLYHIEFYWKIYSKVASANRRDAIHISVDEGEGEKIQSNSLKNFNMKLTESHFDLPSTTAFVDYLIMELWTTGKTSLRRFYDIAFEEADYNKIIDLEMQNMQQDKVALKSLKSLYQQLCFLMNYKESELSSSASLSLLADKGMVLTNTDSHRPYLIRFTMNTITDLSLSFLKNDKKQTSLQIFLELYCEQTNFDEDRVVYDAFDERYQLFCKLNRMEPVMIDNVLLKSEFGIESRTYLKEMVERDKDQINIRQTSASTSLFQTLKYHFSSWCRKKTYYNLKVERLKNVNLLLAGRLNESDIGKEEFKKIAALAILEDYWWLNDFLAVSTELIIDILLSLPFMSIFIFQEIEHSSYSLRDEAINIYGFNIYSNDIWFLPSKILRNSLLTAVFLLFLLFWASCIFNIITNIVKLEFPWIKVFDPYRSARITPGKVLNAYQWWFILGSLWCILCYVILVVIWDIIASIISGQAYLATTSMAIAFIFMVYSLEKEFKRIWWESGIKFKKIFRDIWSTRIRVIVKKMVKYIGERNGVIIEQAEGGVVTTQAVSHKDNLRIIELNMEKVLAENPKTINFVYFFYSLVRQDKDLRSRLEAMLIGSPFSFNKYTTQLLCNVLFMSKNVRLDRFNIEKNIKLVASVIFLLQT